jgi:flagellar motor protein MotB
MGCQGQRSTTQADVNALKADNDRLLKQNEALQGEADTLNARMQSMPAATAPMVTPATQTVPTTSTPSTPSTPFFDLKSIQDQLPPGATVVMRNGEPAIVVEGSLMYGSGSANITTNGKQILDRVAGILNRSFPGHMVRVEGHTDADPIVRTKNLYKNNWELASKRATEVVEYLVTKGVDPKRIYAGSFSMYHPVSTDKTKNRRVEIVVLPAAGSDSGTMPTVKTSKLD